MSNRLLCGVTVELLGRDVPTGDGSAAGLADDGVVGGFNNRGEQLLLRIEAPQVFAFRLRGAVLGEGFCRHKSLESRNRYADEMDGYGRLKAETASHTREISVRPLRVSPFASP